MIKCRYHCRECDACFASLLSFDAHRKDWECYWPDITEFEEHKGQCLISEYDEFAEPIVRDTIIYKLPLTESQAKSLKKLNE